MQDYATQTTQSLMLFHSYIFDLQKHTVFFTSDAPKPHTLSVKN